MACQSGRLLFGAALSSRLILVRGAGEWIAENRRDREQPLRRVREGGGVNRVIDSQPFLSSLAAGGGTHLAMEATGLYSKPVWHVLEGKFELVLANPGAHPQRARTTLTHFESSQKDGIEPGQNNFGFLNEFLDYHLLNYIDDGVEIILHRQMGGAPLQIRGLGRLVVDTLVGAGQRCGKARPALNIR